MFAPGVKSAGARISRSNTGVYNMAFLRQINALDEEARTRLAGMLPPDEDGEDVDPYDLVGPADGLDVNVLMDMDDAAGQREVLDGWVGPDFIERCARPFSEDAAGAGASFSKEQEVETFKEWLLGRVRDLQAAHAAESEANAEAK